MDDKFTVAASFAQWDVLIDALECYGRWLRMCTDDVERAAKAFRVRKLLIDAMLDNGVLQ